MKKIICAIITALLLTLTGNNTLAMKNKNQNSDICFNRYGEPIDYLTFMLNNYTHKDDLSLSKRLYAEFDEFDTEVHIFEAKSKDDIFKKEPILVISTEDIEYPSLLFSPDEKKIAILNSSHYGTIKIYDLEKNEIICKRDVECNCNHIFFSYDSTHIGYCSTNSFAEIINLETRETTWKHKFTEDFLLDDSYIDPIMAQISHDNKYIVTVSQANDDTFDELEDTLKEVPKYIREALKQYENKKLEEADPSFIINYVIEKTNLQSNVICEEYLKYITQHIIKLKKEKREIPDRDLTYVNSMLIQIWDIKKNKRIFCIPIFSYDENKVEIENLFITSKANDHPCCWFKHRDGSITFCSLEKDKLPILPKQETLVTDYDYDQSEKPLLRKFDRTGRKFEVVQLDRYITNIDKKLHKMGLSYNTDNQNWKSKTISAKDIASLKDKENPSLIDFLTYAKASFNKKLFRSLVNMTDITEELSTSQVNMPLEIAIDIVLYAGWKNFAYKKMYKLEELKKHKDKTNKQNIGQNIAPGLTQAQTRDNKKRKLQK